MLGQNNPQISLKPGVQPDLSKIVPVNEALIKTMPEKYIGAAPGKPPVVREIIEKKTVTVAAPKPPSPPVPPKKKSKRLIFIAVGAFVLLIGVGTAAYILLIPAPKAPPAPVVNMNKPVVVVNTNVPPPPPAPVCGNSIVETGEQCDSGVQNGVMGSGCSATCTAVAKTPPPPPNTGTDSDSDGLTDVEEKTVYGSDPHKLDTDDDTFNDGNEVAHLYDPMVKSPALLKDSKEVVMETNKADGYTVLVPSKWVETEPATSQFIATSSTGEFFEILSTPKPKDQSLVEWYLSMSPGATADEVERFKTLQGYDALRSPNRLTTYIDSGDGRIFTLEYGFGDQTTKLEFRTTYEAFLASFTLIKP